LLRDLLDYAQEATRKANGHVAHQNSHYTSKKLQQAQAKT